MRVSRNSRLIIPYLERFYNSTSYYSYSLIRFVAGAMMIPHGYSKLFVNLDGTVDFFKSVQLEPAYPLALYIGILEFFGGIFLALGFQAVSIYLMATLAMNENLFLLLSAAIGFGFFVVGARFRPRCLRRLPYTAPPCIAKQHLQFTSLY